MMRVVMLWHRGCLCYQKALLNGALCPDLRFKIINKIEMHSNKLNQAIMSRDLKTDCRGNFEDLKLESWRIQYLRWLFLLVRMALFCSEHPTINELIEMSTFVDKIIANSICICRKMKAMVYGRNSIFYREY